MQTNSSAETFLLICLTVWYLSIMTIYLSPQINHVRIIMVQLFFTSCYLLITIIMQSKYQCRNILTHIFDSLASVKKTIQPSLQSNRVLIFLDNLLPANNINCHNHLTINLVHKIIVETSLLIFFDNLVQHQK